MVKFTPAYLKKLEDILKELSYEVRYEKGNFKSGYCVLEAKKVVVINKFSTLESRIQALIEIIRGLSADPSKLATAAEEPGSEVNELSDPADETQPASDDQQVTGNNNS